MHEVIDTCAHVCVCQACVRVSGMCVPVCECVCTHVCVCAPTQVINETHENPLYLPGYSLGPNLVAQPDLELAVKDADCIILCAPHQFVHR